MKDFLKIAGIAFAVIVVDKMIGASDKIVPAK